MFLFLVSLISNIVFITFRTYALEVQKSSTRDIVLRSVF